MGQSKSFTVKGTFIGNRMTHISKYVGHGSKFRLDREPENEFDPNAIAVKQIFKSGGSVMLGYVPRELAAEWAPLMDNGWMPEVTFGIKFIEEKMGTCKGMKLRCKLQ